MDNIQKIDCKNFYEEIIKLKEIELYNKIYNEKERERIEKEEEILKDENKKNFIIEISIQDILQKKNTLKNYCILLFIEKYYEIKKIDNLEDIFELFKSKFNLYFKNSNIEKEKEKEIKNNDEIIIDDIPHNYHINIRLKFLELINKKGKNIYDKIIEYINIEILLPIKKFNFKDKKKFN